MMLRNRIIVSSFVAMLLTVLVSPVFAQQKMSPAPAAGAKTAKKMPARDAKGRFIKTEKPATAKKMPPRDAKGRFIKKTAAPAAPATKTP